ncbi:MAG: hypothetical protein CVU38_19470, partial [Chloroflexi bacterium HGW-Chloroflexi-1]
MISATWLKISRFAAALGFAVLLVVSAAPLVSAQGTQNPIPVTSEDTALMQDASTYAAEMGVDLAQAVRQLNLQQDIGRLNAELTESEPETFAGLWIQHRPDYRVIVLFTHDGEATLESYIRGGPLVGIVETRSAQLTLRELEGARFQAAKIADRLGIPHWTAIAVSKNRAELYVSKSERLNEALQQMDLRWPEHVEVFRSEMPVPTSDLYGGLYIWAPTEAPNVIRQGTSGFSASDSSAIGPRYGIVTVGHCGRGEPVYRDGVALPWVRGYPDGADDSAWHTAASGFTVRNLIQDGDVEPLVREIRSKAGSASHTEGTFVCKYGITTGYGCGDIRRVLYQGDPIGAPNVLVDYSSVLPGDSGGPWFLGHMAYGMSLSYVDIYYDDTPIRWSIYMPVHRIESLLSAAILTSDPDCGLSINMNVSPAGAGSVLRGLDRTPGCPEGRYALGAVVALVAAASGGYEFDHWVGVSPVNANPVTVTLQSGLNVTAIFRSIPTLTPTRTP